MADGNPNSPAKSASADESDNESIDEKEEVLLLDSDSEDDSDSERRPEPIPEPKEPRAVPKLWAGMMMHDDKVSIRAATKPTSHAGSTIAAV